MPAQKRRLYVLSGIAGVGWAALTLALLLRFIIGSALDLNVGDVALRDISAPVRVRYISELETRRQQDLAEASVAPIFTPLDAQVARQQLATARSVLDQIVLIRTSADAAEAERIRGLTALKPLSFDEPTARSILLFSDMRWGRVDGQVMSVLDSAMRSPIRPDNLDQARRALRSQISLSLSGDEAALVERIAGALLVPNTNFDAVATDAARKAARDAVDPVERIFEASQIVVRSGQIVGPADLEAMKTMNLLRPPMTFFDAFAAVVQAAVCVVLLALTVVRRRDVFDTVPLRNVALSAAALSGAVLLARWLLPRDGLLPYLAPIATVAIAMTAWSGALAGVLGGLITGFLIGPVVDDSLTFTLQIALGGAVAALVLGRGTRLSDFIRAGLAAGLVQTAVVLAAQLSPQPAAEELPQLASQLIAILAAGVLSSAFALGALYLSSIFFDVTTVVQLTDLARASHPLIQKLLLQAPGTYHHSLMVGNLAEQAAERIGADSLLTRVGAYYHDIGKLENPHHFIENQMEGVNIHDRLDPRTSSALLHAHVTNGLALAQQYKLPERIRAFIAEHHGTMRTAYQYTRACRESDGPVDDAPFRYPGPRPLSRETAILMLADASEATVRASRCETIEAMDAVIRRVIADRLADHQLDDCQLTLRDLDQIRQSFLDTLRGVYHPRVEYPAASGRPLALTPPPAAPPPSNRDDQDPPPPDKPSFAAHA